MVDGASSDETLSIVHSYPQEQMRLLSEPDRGMYDALNKGLRLYTGDAIGVLNSDDCYHDRFVLSRISEALQEADVAHGSLNFVENQLTKRVVRRWRATPKPSKGFRSGWMPAHPTFYVRRTVAEAVGDFDLELKVASDYDWMLRAIELFGFRSVLIDQVMIDMMQGGKSTKGIWSHVAHNIEALHSRRKWLGSGPVDYALVAKPARKLGQFIARIGS